MRLAARVWRAEPHDASSLITVPLLFFTESGRGLPA